MLDTNHQIAWAHNGEKFLQVILPEASNEIMPGIIWGRPDEVFSPAFWKYQTFFRRDAGTKRSHRLGKNLFEELSVCLLGGFGMPAELGLAAFNRLKAENKLDGTASAEEIEALLELPFPFNGKLRKYRFPRQKARYLSNALASLRIDPQPNDPIELRNYLISLNGIGPKTASWVIRNYFDSDDVAILDIHIIRACRIVGLFDDRQTVARHYYTMEDIFLTFCRKLEEPASLVDAIMWDVMRRIGPTKSQSKLAA